MRVAIAVILMTVLSGVAVGSFLSPLNMQTFNLPAFSTTPQSMFDGHSSGGLQLNMPQFSLSSPFQTTIPEASHSNGAALGQNLFGGLNGGQKNDFFSSILSGLRNLPTMDLSSNQNTMTPTATPTPTPTPVLAPTVTPTPVSTEPLPPAGPNTYYGGDNGKTITVSNGNTLHVRLDEAHVCGEWYMDTSDGLQVIGNKFYLAPKSYGSDGRVLVNDDAGTRVFDIKATKPGVQKINATFMEPIYKTVYQNYELTVNVV